MTDDRQTKNAASEGTSASHCSVEIDTDYTPNVVCPHCGYVDKDSWEIDFGDSGDAETEIDCANCDEAFIACRMVTVDYSSRKKPNSLLDRSDPSNAATSGQ